MKKYIFFCTALIISGFVYSQNVDFGIKGGLNYSNINGNGNDKNFKPGLHIGALAEFRITEMFSIQPEILYSTQGARQEVRGGNYSEMHKFKLNYLHIPVLAKFYIDKGFSIDLGPQMGILMKADRSLKLPDRPEVSVGIEDLLTDLDFSFNIGAEYKFSKGLFFQGRYIFGLTDINKYHEFDWGYVQLTHGEMTNGVFQFSIGYKF